VFVKGERADFVLKASRRIASYWLNMHTAKECGTSAINGAALIIYKSSAELPAVTGEAIDQPDVDGIGMSQLTMTTNPVERCSGSESLCVTDIQNMRKMPQLLTKPATDLTMYLPINYRMQATELIST
jgi:hypothetical protein